jgi:hypothetical protein
MLHQKKNKRIPFPEIVSGKEGWKIFEDNKNARTSNMSKEMYVPLNDECSQCGRYHAKMIRRHELGHVKWSPQTKGKLGPDESEVCVEHVEEMRVNYLLARKGLYINDITMCEDDLRKHVTEMIYNASEFEMLLFVIGCMWPDIKDKNYYQRYSADSIEYNIIREIFIEYRENDELTRLRKMHLEWVINKAEYFYTRLVKSRRGGYSFADKISYRKTRIVAKELFYYSKEENGFNNKPTPETVLESARLAAEKTKAKSKAQANVSNSKEESDNENESSENPTLEEAEFETRRMIGDITRNHGGDLNYKPDLNNMSGRWGEMAIKTPELSVNLQGRIKGGREYRPMDFGVTPKYMNRWCVDKKVFQQKQKVYGGTILIDASGSMRFSGDDILEIMQMLPAVKIAMYNSINEDDENSGWGYGERGSLRIIGDNGKRVTAEYLDTYSGGGNLVDGPALKWLSQQKPKRIWVSDMFVFGKGNVNTGNLLQECYQIMKQSGITRLADIDEVKRFALELNRLQ